jgi:flagellar assembly protein FliH
MAGGLDKSALLKTGELAPERLQTYELETFGDVPVASNTDVDTPPDPAEVLARARVEAEEKIREAYEEGLRRGIEAGQEQFATSVAQSAAALQQSIENMAHVRSEFLDSLEPQVVQLAGAIAAQVLRREVRTDPELIVATVRAALENLLDREQLIVRVHPADLEGLKSQGVDLLGGIDGVHDVTLIGDERIESGGCILESDTLHVDARLDTQLRKVFEGLLE